MKPSLFSNSHGTTPGAIVSLAMLVSAQISLALDPTPPADGSVTISPSNPEESWTVERALYPGESVRFTAEVEEEGTVNGKTYRLKGEAKATIEIHAPGMLWTRVSNSGFSFDALNNGVGPVTETVEVSAIWEEVRYGNGSGSGGGGSYTLDTIDGLATGTAYTQRLSFTWYFDYRLRFSDGQSPISYIATPAVDGAIILDLSGYTVESDENWTITAAVPAPGDPLTGQVNSSTPGKGVLQVTFNGHEQDRAEEEIAFALVDLAISEAGDGPYLAEDRPPGGGAALSPPHEMDPGGFILVPLEGQEGDGLRAKLTLKGHADNPDGTFTLDATGFDKVAIFSAAEGGQPIDLPKTYSASEIGSPVTLYVGSEPFGEEDEPQTGILTLTYKCQLVASDQDPELEDQVKTSLSLVEIVDINGEGDSDDVKIIPWDTTKKIANKNIAWIDAHAEPGENANPRMPQLEVRIPGLSDPLTIEAKSVSNIHGVTEQGRI